MGCRVDFARSPLEKVGVGLGVGLGCLNFKAAGWRS